MPGCWRHSSSPLFSLTLPLLLLSLPRFQIQAESGRMAEMVADTVLVIRMVFGAPPLVILLLA